MSKHTPGPWEPFILDKQLNEIAAYVDDCIKASGGAEFYFVQGPHSDGGTVDICHIGNGPRGLANARLIAVVPELLEALKHAVEIAENKRPGTWDDLLPYRVLIAKAEGGNDE